MSKGTHRSVLGIALFIWIGILLNLAAPFPAPWDKVLLWFGAGVFILHALELAAFRKLLGESGNHKAVDALLIIVAGAFHATWLAKHRTLSNSAHSANA
ncbi:MAG: DUF1145 domain-containing protein [Pseudomonadota bacterium]